MRGTRVGSMAKMMKVEGVVQSMLKKRDLVIKYFIFIKRRKEGWAVISMGYVCL